MKKPFCYILTVAMAALLCACMKETILADVADGLQPICFGGESAGMTKSVRTGSLAARDLGNSYTVTGYTVSNGESTLVFDHYKVNYASGTAGSTRSNTSGWEYVGQTPDSLSNVSSQDIKYWDTGAKYIFVAFSKGEGNARFTRVVNTTINNGNNSPTAENSAFRIQGKITDIEGAYYANLQVVQPGGQKPVVTPQFKHLGAKIRLAMYENIPGYSVTDVRFYRDGNAELATDVNPVLYQAEEFFPAADATGTVYVAYPSIDNGTAIVSNPSVDSRTKFLSFEGGLDYVSKENREQIDGNVYLGRSSSTASYSVIAIDIPASAGTPLPINMKVDYTLVPTDGAGERIYVHGATASVPAAYTKWAANSMYTYIFKISDQTSGSTGGGVTGLYPISFDAVAVSDLFDDSQESVTTVTGPSITTYQKDMAITANGENVYNNENLYIVVGERSSSPVLVKGTNINLFTVKYSGYESDQVTETLVAQCFATGDPSDDSYDYTAGSNRIVMTRANELLTDGLTSIPAADSPTGNAITVNCASFVPETNTKYAIQYVSENNECTYKVINIGEEGVYYFIRYTALPGDIYGTEYPMFGYTWDPGIKDCYYDEDWCASFNDNGDDNLYYDKSMSKSKQIFFDEEYCYYDIDNDEYNYFDHYIQGTMVFDNPVTSIINAFICSSLLSIELPSTLKKMPSLNDYGAFFGCGALTTVVLNEGLTEIGDYCFQWCYNLADINIPGSVTYLGEYCFECCYNLTDIDIPGSVEYIGEATFQECSSLTTVTFNEGTQSIGENAFCLCESLDNVILPSSMRTLEAGCFSMCTELTSIALNQGLEYIGASAFSDCESLDTIICPNSMRTLDDYCFAGCSALELVVLNQGLEHIGDYAFTDCHNMETMICLSTEAPDISEIVFGEKTLMPDNLMIYVPDASYEDYVTEWADAVDTDRIVSFSDDAVSGDVQELIRRYSGQ